MNLKRIRCLFGRHHSVLVGMHGCRVLEACRDCPRVRAVVLDVTGDCTRVTYGRWGRSWCGLREAWRRSGRV